MSTTQKQGDARYAALIEAAQAVVDFWDDLHVVDDEVGAGDRVADNLRAALAAAKQSDSGPEQQAEPDMRHPKIQALIGGKARREIELRIAEDLLDDPEYENCGLDGDYWILLHDKIVALQQRVSHQPAQQAAPEVLHSLRVLALALADSIPDDPGNLDFDVALGWRDEVYAHLKRAQPAPDEIAALKHENKMLLEFIATMKGADVAIADAKKLMAQPAP